uniref:Uncharacterized protein n=1 Tax=Arundo donax TaxID=35708 RepID=A0A0A9QSD8_ARUDO
MEAPRMVKARLKDLQKEHGSQMRGPFPRTNIKQMQTQRVLRIKLCHVSMIRKLLLRKGRT